MSRTTLVFIALVSLGAVPVMADDPRTDFEDGTSQGWSMPPPSIGLLSVLEGGNPGFCLAATDAQPDGAPLLARAPTPFVGDLTGFEAIQWDEFVLDYGSATVLPTSILLLGPAGTIWSSSGALETVGSWNMRVVPFVETSWVHRSGSGSFADVLANVEALFISMDTSYLDHSALESMVDNVTLIPSEATPAPGMTSSSWGRVKSAFVTTR